MSHASIIPLIGGELLGTIDATSALPEYILSYEPFHNNDAHLIQYLRKKWNWGGEYKILDTGSMQFKQVESISSVCPCAGLSDLSRHSGADSATNEWLYRSAEFVFENIVPKVYWGENAYALGKNKGRPVAEKLARLGQKYGYSLSLYLTRSYLHGNPQKRPRCFYIFLKGNRAPILPFIKKPNIAVEDILQIPVSDDDQLNQRLRNDKPLDMPFVRQTLDRYGESNLKSFFENQVPLNTYFGMNEVCISDIRKYGSSLAIERIKPFTSTEEQFAKMERWIKHAESKFEQGKGIWRHSEQLCKGQCPAYIKHSPYFWINPYTEDFVTYREGMRVMGMPDDFDLIPENSGAVPFNHISQNVPFDTARDIAQMVVNIDEYDTSAASRFVRIDNISRTVEEDLNFTEQPVEAQLNIYE